MLSAAKGIDLKFHPHPGLVAHQHPRTITRGAMGPAGARLAIGRMPQTATLTADRCEAYHYAASCRAPLEAPPLSFLAPSPYARFAFGQTAFGLRNRGLQVRVLPGVFHCGSPQTEAPQPQLLAAPALPCPISCPRPHFRRSCRPMLWPVFGPFSLQIDANRPDDLKPV